MSLSSSAKWIGNLVQRNINSTINEPIQNILGDIKSLYNLFGSGDTTGSFTAGGVALANGGVTANSMYAAFYPSAAAQALSGAGVVNITAFLTNFTSTGAAQALTLASGAQIGQRKKIYHIVDGGSGVCTAVYVGGTTITFTTVGEFAELIWTGAAWGVLQLGNTTAGGALPALA